MGLTKITGFKGKVFIPDEEPAVRKHNCKDCFVCQMCSDERCEVCLKSHCKGNNSKSAIDSGCKITDN